MTRNTSKIKFLIANSFFVLFHSCGVFGVLGWYPWQANCRGWFITLLVFVAVSGREVTFWWNISAFHFSSMLLYSFSVKHLIRIVTRMRFHLDVGDGFFRSYVLPFTVFDLQVKELQGFFCIFCVHLSNVRILMLLSAIADCKLLNRAWLSSTYLRKDFVL